MSGRPEDEFNLYVEANQLLKPLQESAIAIITEGGVKVLAVNYEILKQAKKVLKKSLR